MKKLKSLSNQFQISLIQNFLLFQNITYKEEEKIVLPNFKYTNTEEEKINTLLSKVKKELDTNLKFENKRNELIFTTNYSIFEIFLNEFIYLFFIENRDRFPGSIPEDFITSPKDFSSQEKIDELWDKLIKQYLKSHFHKTSLGDFCFKFLKSTLLLKNTDIPFKQELFKEISISRNCIIHNNSKINKEYEELKSSYQKHSGDIKITENDINEEIDVFLKLSSILRDSI